MQTVVAAPIVSLHHVPPRPLSDFVALFWYWRGHDVKRSTERILPTGNADLVIKLGNGRTSQAVMSGPTSQPFLIERSAEDALLGVHFKIGGAFPFAGFPLGELHNATLTLAGLWGEGNASRLLCLLDDAPTIAMKFRVLEHWLTLAAGQPLRHHPAVSFALREFQNDPGEHSSAEVAEKTGFSQRRFIELFRNEVGMTPKLFCRVRRFQKAVKEVAQQAEVDWIKVALSCGYFDQSHFIHDFQEFSGLTPRAYLGLRTAHLRHVQVRE